MYLKKLEIFGFKSFADKTVLDFEPGITAIVGPNGCGKSNIFDAVRWVLGEQSIKELRGSAMEDVIFNGTEKKPSLGFAEVSLTFHNKSRMLPMDCDEVVITRRLFRSGESEYLLNKSVVRLKDILEMIMGTGIGAEAYSLVQQGKVDLIVSSKPEDRRVVLDEASGITRYKAKKREALNKLKSTEENLLRVNDITVEVKRQIGSIERQAKKARRYKEKFERLKFLELKYANHQLQSFHEKRDSIDFDVNHLKEKEQELSSQLAEYSSQLEHKTEFVTQMDHEINEIREAIIKLDGQIELNKGKISFNTERIDTIDANEHKVIEQKEVLIQRCQTQQERLEGLKNILIKLQDSIQSNEQVYRERKGALETVEESIEVSKKKIQEHEESILLLTSKQVNLRNELQKLGNEVHGSIARKRRLELEQEKVSQEMDMVNQKFKEVDAQVNRTQQEIQGLQDTRQQKDKRLSDLKVRISYLDKTIDGLEKKKVFYKSQKEFIEKMQTQYHDIPDPIIEGRLFTRTKPSEHHSGILGKVKEVHSVDPDRLPYVSTPSQDQGEAAQKYHGDDPAEVISAYDQASTAEPSQDSLYEIICEAKFIELDLQQINHKISEIGSRIEELSNEKENVLSALQEERRNISLLDDEIHKKEKARSVYVAQRADVVEEVQKVQSELDLVKLEIAEMEETLAQTRENETRTDSELRSTESELDAYNENIKDKRGLIASKSQEREQLIVSVTQIQTEMQSNKDRLHELERNQKESTETLDTWLDELKRMDDEMVGQKEKQGHYRQEIVELEKGIADIGERKKTLTEELRVHSEQKEEVAAQVEALREHIHGSETEIESVKQEVHDRQMNEQKLEFGEKEIKDKLMQVYKIDFDAFVQGLKEDAEASSAPSKVELIGVPFKRTVDASEKGSSPYGSQLQFKLRSQEDQERYKMTLEELHKAFDVDEVVAEIGKLQRQCESFGSVNLVAIEEYEDLKERFEFLTQQQSDLLESKSQLMSTIRKINRSTKQMFMDTFTKVSEEFRIYFRMLFGGGEANLILLDPENVLESGIDIIARPPGKKLQNISLLSGGEKTLTAIALIFGIFKVNPSPFCVLDEIDAALDESNIGRFVYLLKDFAKIAQFIIITHSKKTISGSDIMYGITMPETGISRIVSVKFSDKEEKEAEENVPAGV
jgi:chromosome segregation protein